MFLTGSLLASSIADACTRFVYMGGDGQTIAARSMDWKSDAGTQPGLSLAAWAQYVLDNFSTVDEAVTELEKQAFTVVTDSVPGEERLATLHLTISDVSGDSAIIEYIDGKQVIHHSREYRVATNSPTYDKQLALNEYWNQTGGTVMLPGTNRASDRFARAAFYSDAIPKTSDPVQTLVGAPAYAERVTDESWIQAGLFRPSFDSDVQVSLPNGPVEGTQINLETDLGMAKHKNIAQIEAGVRLTPRLRLEGGYIALKRKTAHELERDILWEDTLYPAHADIGSGIETDIFRVALGYSLLKNDHVEMGVRLGAHITHFDMFIEGSAMVGGQPAGQRRERKNKILPLPNVGVFANVDISPIFSVHGGANYLR